MFLLLRRVLRLPPTAAFTTFFELFEFAFAFAFLLALATTLALTLALTFLDTFLDTFADNVFVDGTDELLFGLDGPSPIVSILRIGFIN